MSQRKLYRKAGILCRMEKSNPFHIASVWKMVTEIEAELKDRRYVSLVLPVSEGEETEDLLEKIMLSGVGAIFAVQYGDKELFHRLENMDIPVVILKETRFLEEYSTVCADDFQGAYEGTSRLLDRIAPGPLLYLGDRQDAASPRKVDRWMGFQKALAEKGRSMEGGERIDLYADDVEAVEGVFEMLAGAAGVCFGDPEVAQAVLSLLVKRHALPADPARFLVLGADGEADRYPLCLFPSVAADDALLGRTAAKIMLDNLERESRIQQVLKLRPDLRDPF